MVRLAVLVVLVVLVGGCRGSSPSEPDATTATDALVPIIVDDGTPIRRPCTGNFGGGLTKSFGRLDGILVAIVPPGSGGCNADRDHVHLQIEADGETYDVAINIDVRTGTRDLVMPGPAWSDGWKTGIPVKYPMLDIHTDDLVDRTRDQLVAELMTELGTVNHISIFGIGYGPEGAHNVHRNDFNQDGMVLTQPLSTPARARLFAFSTQTF